MREYIELGSTPYGESCAQVGADNYYKDTMIEIRAYINQLKRLFPNNAVNFSFKSFPHDFGTYHEVVVYYIPGTKSEEDAYDVEGNLPEYWDEEAKKELQTKGYTVEVAR